MDTSIIWTPLCYGQFNCSLRVRNPYKAYFSKTDTSIIWTLINVLLVSVIKRFDCICPAKIEAGHMGSVVPQNLPKC